MKDLPIQLNTTGIGGKKPPPPDGSKLTVADRSFVDGLENIVNGALERHPRGERFVYGIHQGLTPAMIDELRGRYAKSGWSDVIVKETGTGAYLLVLKP